MPLLLIGRRPEGPRRPTSGGGFDPGLCDGPKPDPQWCKRQSGVPEHFQRTQRKQAALDRSTKPAGWRGPLAKFSGASVPEIPTRDDAFIARWLQAIAKALLR